MTVLPENILKCMDKPQRAKLGKAGATKAEIQEKQELKSEAELQNQIAAYLRINGIAFSRSRMDRRSTTTIGWPDFVFCVQGIPIALECKMRGNKAEEDQLKCHKLMQQNGWRVYVVYALQEVIDIIRF